MDNTKAITTTEAPTLVIPPDALPLEQNPAAVYLASLGNGSRRAMRGALDNIARILTAGNADALTCNWAALRFQHTAAIRAQLIERYAPATARRHLSALRGTLKAAWRLGQIDSENYRRAVDLESVKGETLPAGRMLTSEEIAALMAACANDPSPAGARDSAMIALLVVAGPRRAEIVGLDVADYDADTGAVTIRHGKSSKERVVYVDNGAKDALDDWLGVRGPMDGPLFVPVHQSGRMRIARMTTQAVYNILGKRAREASIEDASPHDMRRTAISNLIEVTDLATAQKIAGHDDPKTTSRYDRRGERAKREVAARVSVPYKRRK